MAQVDSNYLFRSRGHKLLVPASLDVDSMILYANDLYEPTESDLVETLLTPGMTFLDVGANVGHYSLIAARRIGSEGRVFAFEPDESVIEALQSNALLNRYSQISVIQKPISCIDGAYPDSLRCQVNCQDSGWSEVATLDEVLRDYSSSVDFVKIDVEGTEPCVFQGMKTLLNKNRKLMILAEYSPRRHRDPVDFFKRIAAEGFEIYLVRKAEIVAIEEEAKSFPVKLKIVKTGSVVRVRNFEKAAQEIGPWVVNLLCLRDPSQTNKIKELVGESNF